MIISSFTNLNLKELLFIRFGIAGRTRTTLESNRIISLTEKPTNKKTKAGIAEQQFRLYSVFLDQKGRSSSSFGKAGGGGVLLVSAGAVL